MESLKLVKPRIEFQDEYFNMIKEWENRNEKIIPSSLVSDSEDFSKILYRLEKFSKGIDLSQEIVPSTTYFMVNESNEIIGAIEIRHFLNEGLSIRGGHMGYGIRPSERQNGYATIMLNLALEKAKEIGITKVLITCDKDNIGSAKTIINNNGILDNEVVFDENIIQRYWIDLNK